MAPMTSPRLAFSPVRRCTKTTRRISGRRNVRCQLPDEIVTWLPWTETRRPVVEGSADTSTRSEVPVASLVTADQSSEAGAFLKATTERAAQPLLKIAIRVNIKPNAADFVVLGVTTERAPDSMRAGNGRRWVIGFDPFGVALEPMAG